MMHRAFNIAAYPFVFLLTALVTGIVLQQQIPDVSGVRWFINCLSFTVFSIVVHRISSAKPALQNARNALLFLAFGSLGMSISYYQNASHDDLWYGHYTKEITALNILITEPPIIKAKTYLVSGSIQSIRKKDHWIKAKGAIKIYVYKGDDSLKISAGQNIIIPNLLTAISTSNNPFSFNQTLYATRNGPYHQCFLSPDQWVVFKNTTLKPSLINTLRQSIQNAIHKNVKDTTTKGLIDAMLLNDRISLNQDIQQAYATTGIIHILAISGMHVLLLAGIILWILKKVPIKKLQQSKYLIALILVWIYIAITGFPPSANRSAVMFTIYAVGISLQKDSSGLNTWAASGFVLLCYNPYWIYDVGFQLSFLAVLSILLFNKTITRWWQPDSKWLKTFWGLIAMSISVQILVFPLVIYYFNQFPILVFLANIPAGLYSTILMIGAIAIFVLDCFGIGCLWIGQLLTIITKGFNSFVVLLSNYSPQNFRMLFIDETDYWLMMIAIIFICVYCYYKNIKQLLIGLGFAFLLILNFIRKDFAAMHQERIVVYNLNKESQVDIFKSKSVVHLYPINQLQYNFAVRHAVIGFHASKETTDTIKESLFRVHQKSVLVIRGGSFQSTKPFPVDVLIISKNCVFEPEKWFNAFHPKKIIIDGSLPRWQALKWKAILEQAGAKVHAVILDGAWVYPQA